MVERLQFPPSAAAKPAVVAVPDDLRGFTQVNVQQTNHLPVVAKPAVNITDDEIDKIGATAMSTVSNVTSAVLSQARVSDVDDLGVTLNELISTTKKLDPTQMGKPSLVRRLLGFGSAAKEKLMSEYQTVEQRIDALTTELDQMAALMRRRVGDLEQMYTDNHTRYRELEQAIAYGNQILTQMRDFDSSQPAPADSIQAMEVDRYRGRIDRLDRRIDNLKRGQLLFQQALPEITLEQNNKRSLAESVATIQTTLIPAWKGVFSRYILNLETKKGAEIVNSVYDATDAAFRLNADQMRQNAVIVAQQQQRSIVSTETLIHCQNQLIGAIDDVQRVMQEGRASRAAAVPQLKQLEQDLIQRFSSPSN